MSSGSRKNCYQQTLRLQIIYNWYMYKQDLALHNLQGLIWCETQPSNQPTTRSSCSTMISESGLQNIVRKFNSQWILHTIELVPHKAKLSKYLHSVKYLTQRGICRVGWGYKIHRLHLCRGVRPPNECPAYDTKQSDGEVSIMLGLWGIRSTPSLPLLPGPLWPGMVAPDRALSMG